MHAGIEMRADSDDVVQFWSAHTYFLSSLPVCLSVSLSACTQNLNRWMHVLSVCLSVCLSVSLSYSSFAPVQPCAHNTLCVRPSVHLSVCPSVRISICPSLCLSVRPSPRAPVQRAPAKLDVKQQPEAVEDEAGVLDPFDPGRQAW
jgi:hypothetical protein